MFQIGEVVSYGATGICTIEDIRMEALSRSGVKKQEYYILRPIAAPTCITYVPTGNEALAAKIRRVLNKEQIDEMTDDTHYRKMLKELRQPVDDLKTFIAERKQDIQKTQFVTYDAEIHRQLTEILAQKFSDIVLTSTAKNNIEINNTKANKGQAIWALADYLGVPRENTISFGDALNDMAMIKAAGTGVAMANACEEIKAVADFITLSNDEDGVAYGIKKLCLKD